MVSRTNVIDAVLRIPFPLSTPRHWASPQLSQVQVIIGDMACQVVNNVMSTMVHPQYVQLPACGPLASQVAHLFHRDGRTGLPSHIHKRDVMEPPGRRSGVRYQYTYTSGSSRAAPESVGDDVSSLSVRLVLRD